MRIFIDGFLLHCDITKFGTFLVEEYLTYHIGIKCLALAYMD